MCSGKVQSRNIFSVGVGNGISGLNRAYASRLNRWPGNLFCGSSQTGRAFSHRPTSRGRAVAQFSSTAAKRTYLTWNVKPFENVNSCPERAVRAESQTACCARGSVMAFGVMQSESGRLPTVRGIRRDGVHSSMQRTRRERWPTRSGVEPSGPPVLRQPLVYPCHALQWPVASLAPPPSRSGFPCELHSLGYVSPQLPVLEGSKTISPRRGSRSLAGRLSAPPSPPRAVHRMPSAATRRTGIARAVLAIPARVLEKTPPPASHTRFEVRCRYRGGPRLPPGAGRPSK